MGRSKWAESFITCLVLEIDGCSSIKTGELLLSYPVMTLTDAKCVMISAALLCQPSLHTDKSFILMYSPKC